jgi:thioredoxin 2
VVREIARELAGKVAVVQINTEENPAMAARFAIRGIPAMLVLKRGKTVAAMSGVRPRQTVINWVLENAS